MKEELHRLKSTLDFELNCAKKHGAVPSLKNLKHFYAEVAEHIEESLVSEDAPIDELKPRNILKHISDIPYLAKVDLEIFKPRGCIVTLAEYGKVLEEQCKVIVGLEERLLKPFHAWVSQVLGNPRLLNGLQSNRQFNLIDVGAERAKLIEVVELDSTNIRGTYGTLLKRDSDWSIIYNNNNNMANLLKGRTVTGLEKRINNLKKISDTLINEIENNADYNADPNSIEKLANLLYALGAEIEYYGLILHLANAYHQMVRNNEDRIKELTR